MFYLSCWSQKHSRNFYPTKGTSCGVNCLFGKSLRQSQGATRVTKRKDQVTEKGVKRYTARVSGTALGSCQAALKDSDPTLFWLNHRSQACFCVLDNCGWEMFSLATIEDLCKLIEHPSIPVSVPLSHLTAVANAHHFLMPSLFPALSIENMYYLRQEVLKCVASLWRWAWMHRICSSSKYGY